MADVNPEKEPYQSICTFLICDEIIGWNNDIYLDIQKIYLKNDINVPFHFNIILSLKDGVIAYDVYKIISELKKHDIKYEEASQENGEHLGFAS